jgi:iron complex outermembrane receptor protein
MNFRRTRIAAALGLGGIAVVAAGAAAAQDIKIQVTGTNIPRVEVETSAPVQVLSARDIQETGLQTISEVLRQITANNNGSISDSFTNGFSAGGSAVSLRGLGPNNTLVLVNGRRMASYGLADDGHASYVDLQQIPMEAVERIEILKDGASAIYGSDAVAGVVNVILRQTFTGIAVNGLAGANYKGNGKDWKAALTAGAGDLAKDRYNAFGTLAWQKQEALPLTTRPQYIGSSDLTFMGLGDQRPGSPFIPSGGPGFTSSGVVRPVNGVTGASPGAWQPLRPLNCAPESVDRDGYCRYETKQYGDHQPEVERVNVLARGTYAFPDNTTQAYAELSYFEVRTHIRGSGANFRSTWPKMSEAPYFNSTTTRYPAPNGGYTAIFLPVGHPDNPFNSANQGARIWYSTDEIARSTDLETGTQRYLLGVKGVNRDWDWDVAGVYIRSETTETLHGVLRHDRLLQAVKGTGPYGYYRFGANAGLNDPAIYGWLAPDLSWKPLSQNLYLDAKASRDVTRLAGGQLALAVGTQWWREKLDNPGIPGAYEGNVVGYGYAAAAGSRDVWALFGEVYAPLLKNLEVTAAVRMDAYSDVGTTWNPKVGVKWTAVPRLVVRGSWATGFRAPGLYESGTAAGAGFTTARDPVRCAVPGATGCTVTAMNANFGNPDIRPERSTTWTAGLVFEPLSGFNGTLDYWRIDVRDQITVGCVQCTLNNPANFPNSVIIRDTDNLPGIPNSGQVQAVMQPYQNAAKVWTDGFDLDLRYRWNLKEYGRVTPELQWTHLFNYRQTLGNGQTYQYVGTQGNYDVSSAAGTPQDRANLIVPWDWGPWNVTGTVRYVSDFRSIYYEGAYEENGCIHILDQPPECHVASFTTLDLSASYKGFKDWEIYGSIINVFNRIAPFNPAAAYGGRYYNYNYAASGATGTVFNLGVRYTFR